MEKKSFKLPAMYADHHVVEVRRILLEMPGVQDVYASSAFQVADVTFDPTATHITPLIVDILADCEHPADVAYHLAKNRVDGVKISRMTPTMAAREIAKLDLRFGDGESAPNPPKKTTSAPPPIKPVGSSNTVAKDPEKMTQAEFEAHRKAQGAKPY